MASQFPPLPKQRILLVEDNHASAMVLEVMLRGSGREVLGPVESVSEALTLVQARRPDLAVVDVHLSGERSGIQLAESLLEQWSVPTLLVSASDADANAACDVAMGFLQKPFGVEALIESIEVIQRMVVGETYQIPPQLKLPNRFRRRL